MKSGLAPHHTEMSLATHSQVSNEDLLTLWLSLSDKERQDKFADTATAARKIGLSQRTVQAWIDTDRIRAVPVGKKYQVYLVSLKRYLFDRVDSWASCAEHRQELKQAQ